MKSSSGFISFQKVTESSRNARCSSLSFVILGTAPILLFSGGLRSAVVTEMVYSSFEMLVEFTGFLMEPEVLIGKSCLLIDFFDLRFASSCV